jgi:hypothetical protein
MSVDTLPSFALWLAFPTSDYYGGSDAIHVSLADCSPISFRIASHVHDKGLYEIV